MATDWDSAIGGLGQLASGLLGYNNNPADSALKYSDSLESTISPYFDPYMKMGKYSLGVLGKGFSNLIANPGGQYDKLSSGFEASPGYQYQYDTAMNSANQAAAAGGMLGSPAHQTNASKTATQLANQDFYNYTDRVTDLFKTGLSGMTGLNQMGYDAASSMAGYLAQNIINQAMIAAMGAKQQNSSAGSILGGVTDIATSLF